MVGVEPNIAADSCVCAPGAETITRRTKGWAELGQRVTSDLKQFERSAPLAEEARAFQNLMVRATHHATSRFQTYRERLLKSARVLVIDADTLGFANDFRDKLQLPDAVMLASVLRDLDGSAALFVNRNRKDFDDPDIRSELASKSCSVKWTFGASVAHLTSALSDSSPRT